MELDVLGLFAACSYALDCVEAEFIHVTSKHARRVAYMSVCTAEQLGVQGKRLQDLAVCALLHDNALIQYVQEEFYSDISPASVTQEFPQLSAHCISGEKNIQRLPFHTDVSNVILYHHENGMEVVPLVKHGQRCLSLHVLYTCVTHWMSSVTPKHLHLTPGKKQMFF